MKIKENKKNICVRMNPKVINLLDEIAKKKDIKKVEIIESAIKEYIKQQQIGGM